MTDGRAGPGLGTTGDSAVGRAVTILLVSLGLAVAATWESPSFAASATAALAAGVAALVATRRLPGGTWSPGFMFTVCLVVFHLGLAVFPALGLNAPFINPDDYLWFYSPSTARALDVTTVGLLAFALGASLPPAGAACADVVDRRLLHQVGLLGCLLTVTSIVAWFGLVVLAGGPGLLTSSYGSFLGATRGLPLPWIYALMGFGMCFAGLGAANTQRRVALWCFAAFALVGLPLGLRGEVLFPALAHTVLRAASGARVPRGGVTVITGVVVLAVSALVQQLRQFGLSAGDITQVSASPLAGLAELGYTLRVVATSVAWHDYGLEPTAAWATYSAPVLRGLAGVLGLPRPPGHDDPRLLNVVIERRVGPIGGSVIAEAHHNAGTLGVIVVLLAVGLLLARLSRRPATTLHLMVLAAVFVPLLNHVRNSFAPIPAQVAVASALLLAARLVPVRGADDPSEADADDRHRSSSPPVIRS